MQRPKFGFECDRWGNVIDFSRKATPSTSPRSLAEALLTGWSEIDGLAGQWVPAAVLEKMQREFCKWSGLRMPWNLVARELGKLTGKRYIWTYPPGRERIKKMAYLIPDRRTAGPEKT